MQIIATKDLERVRLEFTLRGETILDWAKQHGFRPSVVYQVLSGRTLAIRGESHHVAVALGLKPKPPEQLAENQSRPDTLDDE